MNSKYSKIMSNFFAHYSKPLIVTKTKAILIFHDNAEDFKKSEKQ